MARKNEGARESRLAREQEDGDYRKKKFVVVVEQGSGAVPMFMADEDEKPMRFASQSEARRAAHLAMWENAWVWWIIELTDEGEVKFGTDVRL